MAFDPDAYAAEAPAPKAFDPDAYVGESRKRLDGASPTKWSQKLGEGMLPGFNRVTAAVQAAVDPLIPGRNEEWGSDYGTRYAEHLRANQHQSAQTQREAPIPSALLQTAGALPTAVAAGPATAGQATLLGAAYGAGDSQGRDPEEILADTMLGAGGGRAAAELPHAFLGAENAVRRGARLVMPKINPTPAAQRLMSEGVPLTSGQMQPDSTAGLIEEAASHNPLGLHAEREAALDAARNVALNRTVAPGAKPPAAGSVQDRLRAIYQGFGPAYDQIRGVPVDPSIIAGMPEAATKLPGGIDAKTRAGVRAAIENAMTVLPEGAGAPVAGPRLLGISRRGIGATPEGLLQEPPPISRESSVYRPGHPRANEQGFVPKSQVGPLSADELPPVPAPGERLLPGTTRPAPGSGHAPVFEEPAPRPGVTAGDLMKVRENIRAESRIARWAQDFDRLRLLGHAEDVVTDAMEKALPPEQAAKLRAIDRQYARYNTLEDAAGHAGPESEFTPKQLSAAVARSAGRRSFVQGDAGDLQTLAQDMNSVFGQRVPPTGMRAVVLSGMPKAAAGPMARFINLPDVQAGLLPGGSFVLPSAERVPGPAMSLTPQAAAMADVLRRRIALTPATAEDDRSP